MAIAISLLIGGPVAIVTFPLGSLALGWFLYRRYPLFYSSFTWWMWFVGPLIRRIIDLRCGYLTVGPWTLVPLLVTSFSILTLLKYLPQAHKLGRLPFVIAAATCLYSYLINLTAKGFVDLDYVFVGLFLGYLGPIAFGFHLLIHWRDYPSYRQNLQRTFLWGILFMGFYGIVQYVLAPPWDVFWLKMIQAGGEAGSFGTPEPFGIRVCSSMDAAQPFASAMGSGLILLFSIHGSQQSWASGLGYFSLLFSLARSGWLSWLTGTLVFFRALKLNQKIRMVIGFAIAILIIVPILTIEPFSTVIGERIGTLGDTDSDGSLNARREAFNLLFGRALVAFVGYGMQSPIVPDITVQKGLVIGDNGILVLMLAFGLIGAGPYVMSLISSIFQIQQACLKNNDLVLQAAYAIILGQLSQVFFKNIFNGAFAMVLWGFIGIGMSGRNYYLSQRISEKSL